MWALVSCGKLSVLSLSEERVSWDVSLSAAWVLQSWVALFVSGGRKKEARFSSGLLDALVSRRRPSWIVRIEGGRR
jgi:hypothetical protein